MVLTGTWFIVTLNNLSAAQIDSCPASACDGIANPVT
jgi:hypothetical protein